MAALGRKAVCSYQDGVSQRQILHDVLHGGDTCQPRAVIEFHFMAAVSLEHALDLPVCDLLDSRQTLDTPSFATTIWQHLGGSGSVLVRRPGDDQPGSAVSFDLVFGEWARRWQLQTLSNGVPRFVGWRMWARLALLTVSEHRSLDLVPVYHRLSGHAAYRLLTDGPPQRLLLQYLALQDTGGLRQSKGFPHQRKPLSCNTTL